VCQRCRQRDVALVAVAAERAPAVLEECGNKGIRFVS
jgi:acyl-CoA synthetase (NDP forming)